MPFITQSEKQKITTALTSPETFVSTLLAIVIDHYGTESFDWEAASLKHELETDYRTKLPRATVDRIMAGIVATTTSQFEQSVEGMQPLVQAFNRRPVSFREIQLLGAADIAWAVTEIELLLGQPMTGYTPEVQSYVGLCMQDDGFTRSIPILDFANIRLVSKSTELVEGSTLVTEQEHVAAFEELRVYVEQQLRELLRQLGDTPLSNADPNWREFLTEAQTQLNG